MNRSVGSALRSAIVACACLLGLLPAAAAGPALAAPGAGWLPQPSATGADLRDVALVGLRGWAVGANGAIIATSDGGASWSPQASDYSGWLFGVAFPDDSHGWAVGGAYGATILGTSDGGDSWSVQGSVPGSLQAVDAVDASHAWAVGGGDGRGSRVLATDGGGWSQQDTPAGGGRLLDVDAVDQDHVWAVGHAGTIITTADGGDTWLTQHSDPALTLTSVTFIDPLQGWAAGFTGSGIYESRAVLLATVDGGATWVERYVAVSQSSLPTSSGSMSSMHGRSDAS